MTKLLCLGAGVNSTALLVLRKENRVQFDAAVFADTGGEYPETYQYLYNTLIPFCLDQSLPLHIVRSPHGPLYDYYFARRIIPTRLFRHCTDRFKVQPMKAWAKTTGEFTFLLGIDAGEKHRAKAFNDNEFPLIDLGLDRADCARLIQAAGLPMPRKSGCWFCPFQGKAEWMSLLRQHRDLFLRAEALEQNCQRYPGLTLTAHPLAKLRDSVDGQTSLATWICDEGIGRCMFCEQMQERAAP